MPEDTELCLLHACALNLPLCLLAACAVLLPLTCSWRPFLAALLCSSCTLLVWCSGAWFLRKRFGVHGPGISGLVMRIPGAKWVTASPNWTPDSQASMQDALPRSSRDSKTAAAAKSIDTPPAV